MPFVLFIVVDVVFFCVCYVRRASSLSVLRVFILFQLLVYFLLGISSFALFFPGRSFVRSAFWLC
jgi:hypothetical protein